MKEVLLCGSSIVMGAIGLWLFYHGDDVAGAVLMCACVSTIYMTMKGLFD